MFCATSVERCNSSAHLATSGVFNRQRTRRIAEELDLITMCSRLAGVVSQHICVMYPAMVIVVAFTDFSHDSRFVFVNEPGYCLSNQNSPRTLFHIRVELPIIGIESKMGAAGSAM